MEPFLIHFLIGKRPYTIQHCEQVSEFRWCIIRWDKGDETNPCILSSQIFFWNIVNRKRKSNFPKSDKNHYNDPIKEWKYGHPYGMKNCRGGQNRALCISCMIWDAMRPVHVLSPISTCFNIIWSHGCARTSIVCIRPYFDLFYNFSFHKDVWIFTP